MLSAGVAIETDQGDRSIHAGGIHRYHGAIGDAEASGTAWAPVVIDNKPGANSIVGVDAPRESPADGYTLAVVIAAYAANTTLYPKLPYDPTKDLAAVSLIASLHWVAAVNNATPSRAQWS